MKLNYNQFLAVIYADVFDWCLTGDELSKWRIRDLHGLASNSRKFKVRVRGKDGYYFLPGREWLVRERVKKEKVAGEKINKAKSILGFLIKIPTVGAIFLTGSVAVGNAKKSSDIDLMIVTKPGVLWATRLLVVRVLRAFGEYGNRPGKVCPNIFLDTRHLKIKEKNLYTAHEVLQAKCLFDRGGVEREWLTRNSWTKKYLPNAYLIKKLKIKSQNLKSKFKILAWIFAFCLLPFELTAFIGQYFYMRRKMTNEQVGWGYAFFHPRALAGEVEDRYRRRLIKYSS